MLESQQRKVNVLVSTSTTAILAAKEATTTIPIVMVMNVDPVATGIVESLARPGCNITGLTRLTRALTGKRLELLQEVVPTLCGQVWLGHHVPAADCQLGHTAPTPVNVRRQ